MLWPFGKKKEEVKKSSMQLWLDTANEAYELACSRRLTSVLGDFFTGNALRYLIKKISHLQEDSEGLSTYRKTIFKRIKTNDNTIKYKRYVTFEDVVLSHNVSIPLGTPYTEKWTLSNENDTTVYEIEKCEDKQ